MVTLSMPEGRLITSDHSSTCSRHLSKGGGGRESERLNTASIGYCRACIVGTILQRMEKSIFKNVRFSGKGRQSHILLYTL